MKTAFGEQSKVSQFRLIIIYYIQLPTPREPSPEPTIPASTEYARPCPHCSPHNQFGWTCPTPVVDPSVDAENAWHLDEGAPPGHAFCGNW